MGDNDSSNEVKTWGGARKGAGRKPKTGDNARKGCTLRATAEEWQLHLAFDKIIKYGDKKAAIDFINSHKV